MDSASTNLSAHARPWAPGAPGNPQQQQQQQQQQGSMRGGAGGNNSYSNVGTNTDGAMQRSLRSRGSAQDGSNNNFSDFAHPGLDYSSSAAGMPHSLTPQQQQPKISSTAAKLFVGQLPFECTEERLHNLFSAYGNVEHIHILRDNSNRSRGAAFVTFSTVEEADTAIFTLHNRYRMLTNRAIQVSYAKNSPSISPFGTYSALEVHQSNPTNPLPDVAAMSAQAARHF